ncbi:hypothetical protein [Candidatus Synechococcus spongiarum]|uniref:hypothetical protein n=1 Tax=Candidatus Synechococcus spongiarum TaxID=431041 RepID=UPI00117883C8|nr:hypothetical protein [Candidatus Synechococcus spongiarum]
MNRSLFLSASILLASCGGGGGGSDSSTTRIGNPDVDGLVVATRQGSIQDAISVDVLHGETPSDAPIIKITGNADSQYYRLNILIEQYESEVLSGRMVKQYGMVDTRLAEEFSVAKATVANVITRYDTDNEYDWVSLGYWLDVDAVDDYEDPLDGVRVGSFVDGRFFGDRTTPLPTNITASYQGPFIGGYVDTNNNLATYSGVANFSLTIPSNQRGWIEGNVSNGSLYSNNQISSTSIGIKLNRSSLNDSGTWNGTATTIGANDLGSGVWSEQLSTERLDNSDDAPLEVGGVAHVKFEKGDKRGGIWGAFLSTCDIGSC